MSKDTINERFRMLRLECNKSQEEWGKILCLTKSGVSDIESGRRKVTEKHLKLLATWKEKLISINWLRTGEGEMFVELPPEDEAAAAISNVLDDVGCGDSVYTFIKDVLVVYERQDDHFKDHMRNYISELYNERKKREED